MPFGVVTTMSTSPAACAGVVSVMLVAEIGVTVAAVPPTVAEAPRRFVPVRVTVCPPRVGPLAGLTNVMVGGGADAVTVSVPSTMVMR